MSRLYGGIKQGLLISARSRSMSTYHMKNGTSYTIRAAGVEDYQSVIKLEVEESRKIVSDMELLQDAQVLADRCRRGYQCLVAVGKSPDDKVKDEVLYGTVGMELGLNVPKEKWQPDQRIYAYMDRLVVPAWARRNGIADNLMDCAERLAFSKGIERIWVHVGCQVGF